MFFFKNKRRTGKIKLCRLQGIENLITFAMQTKLSQYHDGIKEKIRCGSVHNIYPRHTE
jgi:hypothetical protein